MTTLAEELEVQKQWRLRDQYKHMTYFDDLARHEFVSEEQVRAWLHQQLQQAFVFAGSESPYYRDLFATLGFRPQEAKGLADLPKLPVLGKHDLQQNEARLLAERLPQGEKPFQWAYSSGTTGRRTRVLTTIACNDMFTYLSQRQRRWHRWAPEGIIAYIRNTGTMPVTDADLPVTERTKRYARWPYMGKYYHTGPAVGIDSGEPIERLLEWLQAERPDYLITYPNILELLANACGDHKPNEQLKSVMAISAQLTKAARRKIEQVFGMTVQQPYGLNEIGVVACRCEADRYHVHLEHCVVEVVDDDGQPCAPGETGRLVVTSLRNPAMPLFRYDTSDIALAVDGPCPCGRTLPSFADVVGRYRPWGHAPPGTRGRVKAVLDTLAVMPAPMVKALRQYQLHQSSDDRFELRLVVRGELPDTFEPAIRNAWTKADNDPDQLSIVRVDDIPIAPSGKHEEFASEFFARPKAE